MNHQQNSSKMTAKSIKEPNKSDAIPNNNQSPPLANIAVRIRNVTVNNMQIDTESKNDESASEITPFPQSTSCDENISLDLTQLQEESRPNPSLALTLCKELMETGTGNKEWKKKIDKTFCDAVLKQIPKSDCSNDPFQMQQLRSLAISVRKLFPTGKKKPKKSDIEEMVKTAVEVFPSRPFYHLLLRWARRRKLHFHGDMLNTLLVIASHYPGKQILHVLQNCRTFSILPVKKRGTISCQYLSLSRDNSAEQVVTKIDITIRLMYLGISSMHDLNLSSVRMNSTNEQKLFLLGPKPTANETNVASANNLGDDSLEHGSSDSSYTMEPEEEEKQEELNVSSAQSGDQNQPIANEPDVGIGNPAYKFKTRPVTGYHLPMSLRNRLWRTFKCLHLGYELY